MNYIKGKIKSVIYQNATNGYLVALFRVKETDDDVMTDKINKTITITGTFFDYKLDTDMILYGELKNHERYGVQYQVEKFEIVVPTERDGIIDFLTSSLIKGCGARTAKNIVDTLGDKALDLIKEDKNVLDKVKGMTENRKNNIYNSLLSYSKSSDIILKLQSYGFNIDESSKIYNKYKDDVLVILENNIYLLNDIIDFKKLDTIFLNNHSENDKVRVKACILEVLKFLSFNKGDTYSYEDEIITGLRELYKIIIGSDTFNEYINELSIEMLVVIDDTRYYLYDLFDAEEEVVSNLKLIESQELKEVDYNAKLLELEKQNGISYNDDQINAICSSLNNNVTIISGGPGTGKTTIINAIVKLYIAQNHLSNLDILENIALLAPTGRASKKMSTSTNLPASTIHRYLKWNKDTNEFMINETNKNIHKLIIVDETSMIDLPLFSALLKGLRSDIKLILVGDIYQLPSVGPGNILSDMIKSDLFTYVPLNIIYRQSDNSYIPYLAREIKNQELTEAFLEKKDDYNFIECDKESIKKVIEAIVLKGKEKGFNEENLQILAPMYKGENGIDNLNLALESIFNPGENKTITYGEYIYKVGDKVLQLVNDADNNVYNGDIGFIENITYSLKPPRKELVTIDFDGNKVIYEKKNLKNIKHAYAITIHKSQGSEFDHVIMPVTINYGQMLYNKLLYTGVSRAKKSLIIVGDPRVFSRAIFNDYGSMRKTSLKEKLILMYK